MDSQQITQEELEQIENYIYGKLDGIELQHFETRLSTDALFKAKVEDIKILISGIEAQALKEQLNYFHEDLHKNNIDHDLDKSKIYNINWKKLLVAAALLIAAGSIWFLNENSNERLYAKHFNPDPGLPTTMGTSDNYEFYEAMVNYKQGDYKTAITKWEALQKTTPNNDTLNYFIGVAHLANKNEKMAIPVLEAVSKNSEFAFINDTYYYLGLAYLKAENIDKAKANLQKSATENSKALLSDLND